MARKWMILLILVTAALALALPSDVGVFIEIASRNNTVSASGLSEIDGTWVNEAYGESPVTLHININTTPNKNIMLVVGE